MTFGFQSYSDDKLLELHATQTKSVLPGRTSSLVREILQEMKMRGIPSTEEPRFTR
jgi:hypothetical protein